MKKTLLFLLLGALLLSVLAGCNGTETQGTPDPLQSAEQTPGTGSDSELPLQECESEEPASGAVQPEPAAEPVILTIASFGGTLVDESLIWDYNEAHPEVQLQLIDYGDLTDHNLEAALLRLHADLVSADAPDLVDVLGFGLNLEKYAAAGVFEDLYPWIDSDPDTNREDYLDSVFSLMTFDGKLQAVMSGFSVKTMYLPQSQAASLEAWTVSDFAPYANTVGQASLFAGAEDKLDRESLLSQLCTTTVLSFVDYEAGQAQFDSPAFRELLELCCSMEPDPLTPPRVRLASEWNFYEAQYEAVVMGEAVSYVGFPTFAEYGARHYVNNQENYLAMSANGLHKDAAWSFLKAFLRQDYQTQRYALTRSPRAFPTNRSALNEMVQQAGMEHYETDADGAERLYTAYGQYDYAYNPASAQEIEQLLALIDAVDGMQGYDSEISKIVLEEASAYFDGAQTLELTVSYIQSRVSLYLSEQS